MSTAWTSLPDLMRERTSVWIIVRDLESVVRSTCIVVFDVVIG